MTFSVIIPTKGRPTLADTLASVTPQLEHGDELLLYRLDCHWGAEARNQLIPRAAGTHLLFIDDDDAYTPGALAVIRAAVGAEPDRVHIFRMQYPDGRKLWETQTVNHGNIGTPMVVVPNQPGKVGTFDDSYAHDHNFVAETLNLRGDTPVFHDDVVALVRPSLGVHGATA